MPLFSENDEMQNFRKVEENDILNGINDMYILIVPTRKECQSREDILKSEKLLTIHSEDFLIAIRSLLGVNENKKVCACQDIKSSYFVKSSDTVLNNKDCHQNNTNETVTVIISPNSESDAKKSNENDSVNASNDLVVPSTNCNETEVVYSSTGDGCKNNAKAVTKKSNTETSNNKQVNPVCSVSFDQSIAGTIDCSNTLQKSENRRTETRKDGIKVNDIIDRKKLLDSLSVLPGRVKDISLMFYCEKQQKKKDCTQLSAVAYLNTYIALLSEFVEVGNISPKCKVKLVYRYMFHLKKLFSRFCKMPNQSNIVISLDQEVLKQVREIGCWDFKKAWHITDKKKTASTPKQNSASTNQSSDKNLKRTRPQVKSRSRQFISTAKRKSQEKVSIERKPLSVEKKPQLIRATSRSVNGEIFAKDGYKEIVNTSREIKLLPPRHGAGSFLIKRKFNEGVADLDGHLANANHSNLRKRSRNSGDDKSSRRNCKYFNQGSCFKLAADCPFPHICNICFQTSHGESCCPAYT